VKIEDESFINKPPPLPRSALRERNHLGSSHIFSLSYVTVITDRVVCSPLFHAGGNVAKPEGVIRAFCLVYLTGVHHC